MEGPASPKLAGAPHLHEGSTTSAIMWAVTLCLVPSGLWGIWQFGLPALAVLVVSIGAALVGELGMGLFLKRPALYDGSAFLSGLLVGYLMPPAVPLYVPLAASLFAMVVVKWSFGGLGSNWMNPALAGVALALLSWSAAMGSWSAPLAWRLAVSGSGATRAASPLAFLASVPANLRGHGVGPIGLLAQGHYPVSPFSQSVAQWLGDHAGARIDPRYFDLFAGLVPGSIGEISLPLLILGSILLFRRRIIGWRVPVAYLGSFLILTWVFGGLPLGGALFHGDPLFQLLAGGIVLGALYMATDPVTAPHSAGGMIVYGVGAGALTFLFRVYGSVQGAMPFAVILMNIAVPAIDRIARSRRLRSRATGADL